jgi:hypothetical protein
LHERFVSQLLFGEDKEISEVVEFSCPRDLWRPVQGTVYGGNSPVQLSSPDEMVAGMGRVVDDHYPIVEGAISRSARPLVGEMCPRGGIAAPLEVRRMAQTL